MLSLLIITVTCGRGWPPNEEPWLETVRSSSTLLMLGPATLLAFLQVQLRALLVEQLAAFLSVALFFSHLCITNWALKVFALTGVSVAGSFSMDLWSRHTFLKFKKVQLSTN